MTFDYKVADLSLAELGRHQIRLLNMNAWPHAITRRIC